MQILLPGHFQYNVPSDFLQESQVLWQGITLETPRNNVSIFFLMCVSGGVLP